MWIYETGLETPEILGSGSYFSNIFTTKNEAVAFKEFAKGRNYLTRFKKENGRTVERQYYNDYCKIWEDA